MKHEDPKEFYVCITDRTYPEHCWQRAATHIQNDFGWNFFERLEASRACWAMAAAILAVPRPPRRAVMDWGSPATWKPIPR